MLEVVTEEQWHEVRQTGIGASEAAICMGLSPWKGPFELFGEKMGLIERGPSSEAAEWGRRHEPTISEWYQQKTRRSLFGPHAVAAAFSGQSSGHDRLDDLVEHLRKHCEIVAVTDHNVTYRSLTMPHMLASPDAFIYDDDKGWAPLELKTAGEYMKEHWQGSPPDFYMPQVQHQMFVTGFEWSAFACLIGGNKGTHGDIAFDQEFAIDMLAIEADFWRRLQENDPPDPDDSESTARALEKIYPRGSGDSTELGQEYEGIAEQYLEAKHNEKVCKATIKALTAKFRAAMGSSSHGHLGSGRTVVRIDKRDSLIKEHTRKGSSFYRIDEPK